MNNFTRINNGTINNIRISDGAYRCYCVLEQYCYGDKTECYPSIKAIACHLGRSCRTVIRYIKELVNAGLIIKRKRGSLTNKYITIQKKIMLMAEKANQKHDNNSDDTSCADKPTKGQNTIKNNSKSNYPNKNKNSKNKGNKANSYKKKEDSWDYEGRGTDYYLNKFKDFIAS